jgi:hypothetical protein
MRANVKKALQQQGCVRQRRNSTHNTYHALGGERKWRMDDKRAGCCFAKKALYAIAETRFQFVELIKHKHD